MSPSAPLPIVASAHMGYGHLRAAHALAEAIGTGVVRIDAPPLASPREVRTWARARAAYEALSRLAAARATRVVCAPLLRALTAIPDASRGRDLSRPDGAARALDRLAGDGLGAGLCARLRATRAPLLATFYAPAIAADRRGAPGVHLVATDVDLHRVWAPADAARTGIRYHVPASRTAERLRAYGVPAGRIAVTGFPLPPGLTGPAGERAYSERLARLGGARRDGRALEVAIAIGGAGAQTAIAREALLALRPGLITGRLHLTIVAGQRRDVARGLAAARDAAGIPRAVAAVLFAPDFPSLYGAFNDLLARIDVLWTKPSELVFYAALGLPLVLAPPLGVQEEANREHVLAAGAAVDQGDPREAGGWMLALLEAGRLADAARAGRAGLPRDGTRRIVEAVTGAPAAVSP